MEDYTSASGRLIRMIVSLVASAGAATFRETFAEALELPVNTYFSCSQSGAVRLYKRISAAPGYRDLGDTAANLFAETAKTYRDQSLEATSEAAAHAMSSSSYAAIAAALLNGMLFTTDAAGVAAVDDGAPFVLQGNGEDGVFGRLKRRVGAAAVDQGISLPALPITATGIADTAEKVIMIAKERVALRANYSTLTQVAATGNFAAADNFRRWAVGIDIGSDAVPASALTAVALRLQLGTGGTKVRLRLWLRPLSSASLDANPGTAGDDALLLTQDYSAASLGLTPGGAAVDARMALPFDAPPTSLTGSCLIIDVEGLDGSDAQVLLGVGNRANPTGLPVRKRGWYFNNLGWGFIASDNAVVLAWKLEKSDTFSGTANDTRVTVIEGRATALETGKVATDISISSLNSALTTTFTNRGEVARNNIRGTGPYTRWFFGGDVGTEIASGFPLTHLLIALATYNTTTTQVRLTVLLRDLASGALNTAGQQSGDVQYGPYTYSLASVSNGVLPAVGASADCRLLMGAGVPASALEGKRVYFFIEGLDAASAYSAIGTGFTTTASGTVEQGKRGYFGASSLANSIISPERIAYRVEQAVMATSGELAAAISAGAQVPALAAKVDPIIPSDLLLPDKLWMTAGRVLPFAARSMYSKRVDGPVLDVSVESLRYLPTSAQATAPKPGLAVRGYGTLLIDPDAVTTSVKVTARRVGVGNTRLQKNIPVSVVPWVKTGSPVIMGIGDSLMAQSKMAALLMELQARGMTPTMRGSLATNFNGQGTTVCEGRGGKAMADFLNIRAYSSANANTMRPCNDITLAQYNALPADGGAGVDARANRNPYLVAGSGAGYYNGFKFSVAQYAAFFGIDLSTLTHVFISLGTNDIFQFAKATALANIVAGIQLIVAEIRAVAPNAHITFVADGCGWRDGINDPDQYYETHHAMMRTQQATVAALADSKVYYVPIGLHQDDNRFGAMTTSTTDYGVMTVVDSVVEAGYVHPTDGNILVGASVLASLVAATTP